MALRLRAHNSLPAAASRRSASVCPARRRICAPKACAGLNPQEPSKPQPCGRAVYIIFNNQGIRFKYFKNEQGFQDWLTRNGYGGLLGDNRSVEYFKLEQLEDGTSLRGAAGNRLSAPRGHAW